MTLPDQNRSSFDQWLEERLQRLYDHALDEPLPDDVMALLQPLPKDD